MFQEDFEIIQEDGQTILEEYTGSDENVTIPEGVTVIGENAFAECLSLTSVVIPDGVTEIGDGAFSGCSSLTSVVIPEGVKVIGGEAFWNCRSLTSVEIPESVSVIWWSSFGECPDLTICAPAGSEAERFARLKRIPFQAR